jgi:hypothetical protein
MFIIVKRLKQFKIGTPAWHSETRQRTVIMNSARYVRSIAEDLGALIRIIHNSYSSVPIRDIVGVA